MAGGRRPLARRGAALAAALWLAAGAPVGAHRGPRQTPFSDHCPPRGWELVQRSVRTHGWLRRWDPIRDVHLALVRRRIGEDGAVRDEVRERQWIRKGRRPRVRIERRLAESLLVLGFDGRRAWVTLNGERVLSERAMVEAEQATRWAEFVIRLPFVLGEKDARSIYAGTGLAAEARPTLRVDVGYVGGTRPSEQRFMAHLDASTYRLERLEYDAPRTPGARWTMDLEDYSSHAGVLVAMRRSYRRDDRPDRIVERIQGVALNQGPEEFMFLPPVPDR